MKKTQPGVLATGAFFAALITLLVFITAKDNQFVALDDFAYIVNNSHIHSLNWHTLIWSFTSFHEGNWHPLTMLSLALDRSLWGLNPFGYHLTNIVLHSCTVFFSCFLFSLVLERVRLIDANPSAGSYPVQVLPTNSHGSNSRWVAVGAIAGALFFGLHPLRVESVVWASERKDVLCLFFMTTSIWMYFCYAIRRGRETDVPVWHYREFYYALLLSALAQMSKPTAVSLPLILFIADWYPLNRITDRSTCRRVIVEKLPFVVLSATGAVLTLFAQQIAMHYAPNIDPLSRLLVACKALLFYIAETIWPTGLAAFYMHPGNVASFALAEYLLYALLVLAISVIIFGVGRRHRVWPAFWLYYVITIAPMLGLIQVGGQWAADRYSYLPALGMSLLWGGWVASLGERIQLGKHPMASGLCIAFAAGQLLFYTVQTVRQIPIWRTTETLATRIIEQAPHVSGAPYQARAIYRNELGRYEQALEDSNEAMKIALRRALTRTYPEIAFEQALILKNLGRITEALTIMEWGIETAVDPLPQDVIQLHNELIRLDADRHPGK